MLTMHPHTSVYGSQCVPIVRIHVALAIIGIHVAIYVTTIHRELMAIDVTRPIDLRTFCI